MSSVQSSFLCLTLLACTAGARNLDAQLTRSTCAPGAAVDTSKWQTKNAGGYSYRLPAEFVLQPDQSIDSAVDEWHTADGRRLLADYGFYNGPFSSGLRTTEFVACQDAAGSDRPQIVIFQTIERQYGVGLYWVIPGGRSIDWAFNTKKPLVLWMRAEGTRTQLDELLTIMRSVRLH